jgi:DNA-binding CsgD family transcriptional regulator
LPDRELQGFGSFRRVILMSLQEYPSLFEPQSLKSMGLTERETEVLTWVAEGKSNSDIATILGIRSATVKKHLEHIFRKMGVETRTAAVAFVLRATRQIVNGTSFLPFVYFLEDLLDDLPIGLTTFL